MSIAEIQGSIQVTANPDALSGLDKGVAQRGESSAAEQGKAPRYRDRFVFRLLHYHATTGPTDPLLVESAEYHESSSS